MLGCIQAQEKKSTYRLSLAPNSPHVCPNWSTVKGVAELAFDNRYSLACSIQSVNHFVHCVQEFDIIFINDGTESSLRYAYVRFIYTHRWKNLILK